MHTICRQFSSLWLLCIVLVGACTEVPPVERSTGVSPDLLKADIEFLAQPALKGRAPRSGASKLAREYITRRLQAYGLKPWAGDSFELPFVIGTNIAAVLPGSDPVLSREFIIFSAHYDHLGVQGFQTYPGACDNASGDAALLEIAQTLAVQSPRPKRSILFVFFDCEEMGLLGSLAFSTRPDFDPHAVAAVVNIDMLGRHAFDLPQSKALVVVGTESYPDLRTAAQSACQSQHLNFLPVGRDLVGPRSDHAAFEAMGFPSILLTCGPNRDYHMPSDTADKMDFVLLERQVLAAQELLLTLANQTDVTRHAALAAGDREELAALKELLEQILAAPAIAGMGKDQVPALRETLTRITKHLDSAQPYSTTERHLLLTDLARQFMPVLLGKLYKSDQVLPLLLVGDLYAQHPATFIKLQRSVAAEIMKRNPDLFHPFGDFKAEATAVDENSLRLAELPDGRWRLSLYVQTITVQLHVDAIGQSRMSVDEFPDLEDITGTRDELIDFALLRWLVRGPKSAECWRYVLQRLTGKDFGESVVDWQKGLAHPPGDTTNGAWVRQCLMGTNPEVALAALSLNIQAHAVKEEELIAMMRDPDKPVKLREQIMWRGVSMPSKAMLAALVDELTDETPISPLLYLYQYDETFPFYSDLYLAEGRKRTPMPAPQALKDRAHTILKIGTKQDHGFDQAAWRKALQLPSP